jgi:hypothetical protein
MPMRVRRPQCWETKVTSQLRQLANGSDKPDAILRAIRRAGQKAWTVAMAFWAKIGRLSDTEGSSPPPLTRLNTQYTGDLKIG